MSQRTCSPGSLGAPPAAARSGPRFAGTARSRSNESSFTTTPVWITSGAAICTNAVVVRQDLLDHAILGAIVTALDPAVLSVTVEKALASLTKRERVQVEQRSRTERELAQIQQRVDRLVDALADGSLPHEELRTRLSAETSRKKLLERALQRLEAFGQVTATNVEKLTARVNAKVQDIVGVLGRQTPQARQMLRKLLTDKIDLEPHRFRPGSRL